MAEIMASVEEQMSVLMRGVEYGDANIERMMEADLRELLPRAGHGASTPASTRPSPV